MWEGRKIKVGSLFSGMEGFGHGLEKAGMKVVWWVEQDKQCHRVLAKHYPDAEGFHDVKEIAPSRLKAVDLITFGWPCQDLSVAGKREGLAGKRSGLFFEAMRIIEALSPKWIIGENVPGLLSAGERRDMGYVIGYMEQLGYCVSWAMLDTQYFHLAQRRERLFFVGSLGNTGSIQVLFESDCGPWDSAPCREKGQGVAGTIGGGSTDSRRGFRNDLDTQGAFVPVAIAENQRNEVREMDVIPNLSGGGGKPGRGYPCIAQTLRSGGGNPAAHGKPSGLDENLIPVPDPAYCLSPGTDGHQFGSGREAQDTFAVVAFTERTRKDGRNFKAQEELAYSLTNPGAGGRSHSRQLMQNMTVRRLTPTECLRLQGFPDDYLDLDPPLSDSAKYRMIGNSVSPVIVAWIGKRIMEGLNDR